MRSTDEEAARGGAAWEKRVGDETDLQPHSSTCCSSQAAWAWIQLLTAGALNGDPDLITALPDALQHALRAERRNG